MCSINIALSRKEDIIEMNNRTKHRGIRSKHEFINNIGFGHVRLPIQGISEEYDQPMINDNEIILFNGEIYSYKELDRNAKCDTELLKNNFNPSHFDGDFAIVKFDIMKDKFDIITDRFGKKQLYYRLENDRIASISSEIKALINKEDKLDLYYISTVARFGYVFNCNNTFIQNIKRFLPSKRYIVSKTGKIESTQDIKWDSNLLVYDANLLDLLELSIKRRLISEIPMSFIYSGGLDSSIVLYHIAKLKQNIKIFTIDNNNDLIYAERYADELGYKLSVLKMEEDDNTYLDAHYFNESMVDLGSVTPKYILFKKIHSLGYNVAIGGTGADEVFGGYKRMQKFDFQHNDIYNELVYYHLPRVEKLSMANTVEYRTPYTADYVIDYGLRLGYKNRINKIFLRNTYRNLIPDYIIDREKIPLKTNNIISNPEEERMKLIKYFINNIFHRYKNERI